MSDRNAERGNLMVGLMASVAILMILSTVGFQSWQDVIRRDKEAEMMFRAQEIARALKKYQKAQGALPTELKKLIEKTGTGQYVLRKLYKDPLVKDGKWGLLFLAPGGGIFDPNGTEAGLDASGQPIGMPTGFGTGTSSFPSSTGTTGAASAFGNQPSAFGNQAGSGGDPQGLPIAGVRTLCTDRPFRVFREQTEYDKWLFSVLDDDSLGPIPGQPAQPKPPGLPGATNPRPPGGNKPQRPGGIGTQPGDPN